MSNLLEQAVSCNDGDRAAKIIQNASCARHAMMRSAPFKLLLSLGLFAAMLSPAAAGWCADYDFGGHDGYRKCGFTSLQQCVWDVRGVGGTCGPSPYSHGPHRPSKQRHYH
jgi:hypothetical protein